MRSKRTCPLHNGTLYGVNNGLSVIRRHVLRGQEGTVCYKMTSYMWSIMTVCYKKTRHMRSIMTCLLQEDTHSYCKSSGDTCF
jgi:hypothetical protein